VATTGIASIDALFARVPGAALATDRESVGAVQALLIGHGFGNLPTLLSHAYGLFGPVTEAAVRSFQSSHGLPASGAVDAPTLASLVTVPAKAPLVSRAYSALVLDVPFTGLLPLAAMTMLFEGGGYFCAANLNTDGCGLSYGLIQWAQRPGRLNQLLSAFNVGEPSLFVTIFGAGDRGVAAGLLAHTAKPHGGVDSETGRTVDAAFDLVAEPWCSRFQKAGQTPALQRIQMAEAVKNFGASARRIQAAAPVASSERALAFMLDVANQFGDAGARSIAQAVARPAMTESEFLAAAQAESVARVAQQYGSGSPEARSTLSRREAIRLTPWLSDTAVTV
jgi:peptidoglycan hydrolase-like protein with peptidoglycan-binding domain